MFKNVRVILQGFQWLPVITSKMPFYAVAKGRTPGIFMSWADCEKQVKGFSGARYKKFDAIEAAQAFINTESNNNNSGKTITSTNGKRRHSATSTNKQSVAPPNSVPKQKKATKKCVTRSSVSPDSEGSDDLATIIGKQLDDLEKRIDNFGTSHLKKGSKTKTTQKKTILLEPPVKRSRKKSDENTFHTDADGFVNVYTDGACSSNGRSTARAGLGVFWANGHHLNTSEPVSGRATNNCGEIQAATRAINIALQNGVKKLAINTDSKFLINSVTKWMPGWKKKGWKLQSGEPVKNQVDFLELDKVQNQLQIKWNYVEAHKGIHGNEMADQLAKAGAAAYNN